MTDRQDSLREAEDRRCAAMLANDLPALDTLIDPRLHFSHANGAVDDKVQYLAKLRGGRIVYLSIDWSDPVIIDLGDTALLTGRMTSRVTVDGAEKTLDNRVLSAWAYSGTWRLVAFQSTPLVAPKT